MRDARMCGLRFPPLFPLNLSIGSTGDQRLGISTQGCCQLLGTGLRRLISPFLPKMRHIKRLKPDSSALKD